MRAWILLCTLTTSFSIAGFLREAEIDEPTALAVLRAASPLTGSGRLALAAAVQRRSLLPAELRISLLTAGLEAAKAVAGLLEPEGTPAALLAAANVTLSADDVAS